MKHYWSVVFLAIYIKITCVIGSYSYENLFLFQNEGIFAGFFLTLWRLFKRWWGKNQDFM